MIRLVDLVADYSRNLRLETVNHLIVLADSMLVPQWFFCPLYFDDEQKAVTMKIHPFAIKISSQAALIELAVIGASGLIACGGATEGTPAATPVAPSPALSPAPAPK